MASLFTSIQQIETEIHKEQETAEQHNRDKALTNLRKARFMKQMQNLTKKLKEQSILTHSYPMPQPTNTTELTKKILDNSPDELPIPDINKDLQEELTKLGLNITLLINANSATNKETLEDTHQCKLSSSPSSASNQRQSTTAAFTTKQPCEDKDVEQSKPTHLCADTKKIPPQELHKSEVSQLSGLVHKNEDTDKMIEASLKQHPTEISNKSSSENSFHSYTKPLKLSRNDHIEAYPWAHQASENFSKTTPLAGKEEIEFPNITYASFRKYLTTEQREKMIEYIALTDASVEKIDKNIGMKKEDNKTIYFCKVCEANKAFQSTAKRNCKRHVRMHLGYSLYRCSFCNFISNNPTPVYSHYLLKHGIPKKWTDFLKN